MKTTKLIFKLGVLSLLFTACTEGEDSFVEMPTTFESGVLISSEGNFGAKDGSVSFVSGDFLSASNFIYDYTNEAKLGGLIQSIAFDEDNAYIILNDVHTLVVVDRYTFEKKSSISIGLNNPRYMTIVNGKGYITNWGEGGSPTDDYLAIFDIETLQMESNTISLEEGVEQIVSTDDKLFVSHKGAWNSNNIVSVIELPSQAVSTIEVKDNPDELVFDSMGNLIVLSQGKPSYDNNWNIIGYTTSAISKIDVDTQEVLSELVFDENQSGTLLTASAGNLYYYIKDGSEVYEISETDTELAEEGISVGSIYGMEVRDNLLYTVEYAFSTLSQLTVKDISSENVVYASTVGLGASKIYFNE